MSTIDPTTCNVCASNVVDGLISPDLHNTWTGYGQNLEYNQKLT